MSINEEKSPLQNNNNKIINNTENIEEQKLVEKIINKWLNLQKTIKEEITLEDVIIKQQEDDINNLKSFYTKYFQNKLNTRKNWTDIDNLLFEGKKSNINSYLVREELGTIFHDATDPIKNLFFIFRNNYNYLTKLISLIKPEDFIENNNYINSLVELLNNNFYENILIPNPEQKELLILIYKLLENEINCLSTINPDNFLKENSFMGMFLSSFAKKQEILGYFSMILNPLILSIDEDDSKDYFDMSINNIIKFIDLSQKNKKKATSRTSSIDNDKKNMNFNLKDFLFEGINKTRIKFKNNFELEAEKEKEDELGFCSNDEFMTDSDKNIIYISKKRREIIQRNNLNLGNENWYNKEYKYDLNQKRLIEKINHENNPEMKNVYLNLLEEINYFPNKYSNEGLLNILKIESNKNNSLIEIYKDNFIYIRDTTEELLQLIVDKIITMPYPFRCICKIISILISKKSPGLTKYEINSFVGKFILNKCIFPILSLENKTFINHRVYTQKTKTCLDIIINILTKANNCSLFDTYLDPEKTIFNQLILEIIPILNKFYEKVIDIQLPKVIDDLINASTQKLINAPHKRFFNFRHKKIKNNITPIEEEKIKNNLQNRSESSPLYEYFKDNPDEILHLQSVCLSAEDVQFILNLIGRNIDSFKDLPKFLFFSKTYKKIKNQEKLINDFIEEDNFSLQKTFFVIFKDEKNSVLEKFIKQRKRETSFESEEDTEILICKRVKFCIKTILKGLNLLNNKDFAYLNFAKSTDKFFSVLKYTLEELGEYNELSNIIPLKWYSQYIYNYKNELDKEYQKDDFNKLYSEIYTEETNILNELKKLSNNVITRNGMNLRCAEKILEKAIYELKLIEESKKYNQLEKFIKTKKIEVCINQSEEKTKSKNKEKELPIKIIELKSCPYKNSSSDKNHSHLKDINDFINFFSIDNKMRLKLLIRQSIIKGENNYKISEMMKKYIVIIKKKIKENKDIFGELKDEDVKEFSKNIENHIIRQIYKYIYPSGKSEIDKKIQNCTKNLEWIQPENLDIKKIYINQLKFAEKYINKLNEAKSVFDKLDCIQNAYVIMNNTVKFISGKNENCGQDELTPLFQYILIKSQPERLSTNVNYIKFFLSEEEIMGKNGFFCSQIESACNFILNMKGSDLKMSNNEFISKMEQYRKINGEKREKYK